MPPNTIEIIPSSRIVRAILLGRQRNILFSTDVRQFHPKGSLSFILAVNEPWKVQAFCDVREDIYSLLEPYEHLMRHTGCFAENTRRKEAAVVMYKHSYPTECEDIENDWNPPALMPSDYCRLHLHVESMSFKSVWDITEQEALDNGFPESHEDACDIFGRDFLRSCGMTKGVWSKNGPKRNCLRYLMLHDREFEIRKQHPDVFIASFKTEVKGREYDSGNTKAIGLSEILSDNGRHRGFPGTPCGVPESEEGRRYQDSGELRPQAEASGIRQTLHQQ